VTQAKVLCLDSVEILLVTATATKAFNKPLAVQVLWKSVAQQVLVGRMAQVLLAVAMVTEAFKLFAAVAVSPDSCPFLGSPFHYWDGQHGFGF
jgi:hypothetical protein